MGAGASSTAVGELPETSDAELATLANTMLTVADFAPYTRDLALRLYHALLTPEGFSELLQLFRAVSSTLDDGLSSEEWGDMVYQDEAIRSKYFGDATPDEITRQFDTLDEECAQLLSLCSHFEALRGL